MSLRLNPKSQKAFTLVETMVTVAIVGIIASITYTISVAHGVDRGKFNASISDLTQIGQAVKVFVTNNNDYPANNAPLNWAAPSASKTMNGLDVTVPFGLQAADNSNWPKGQWVDSAYRYKYLVDGTVQIELYFCTSNPTICKRPTGNWASTLHVGTSNATMYYCVKSGTYGCRSTAEDDLTNEHPPAGVTGICVGGTGCATPKYN